MADPVTWQSLTAVLGASAGSVGVVQFAKVLFSDISPATQKKLSALLGLLIVEVAIFAMDGLAKTALALGLFVGIQAGLAASTAFEIAATGVRSRR